MKRLEWTNKYKKDIRRVVSQYGNKINDGIDFVVTELRKGNKLEDKYNDHPLNNSKYYKNCRECHIKPDLLLIYKFVDNNLISELIRTGSHNELFGENFFQI